MIVINETVPIKSWCNNPEAGAIEQAKHLANLPFVFKQVCLMPDTHQGYGMPIGGVIATKRVVIPNAVGVDIGCGMCVVNTKIPIESITKEVIKKIFGGSKEYQGGIRSCIPVGFNHHSKEQEPDLLPSIDVHQRALDDVSVCALEHGSALKQLGTLGGGNHFIELQTDGKTLWVMIHSGSRNLGYKVAEFYNKLAITLNDMWHTQVPKNYQLAFLPLDSTEARDYLREMNYCVEFAKASRALMMRRVLWCINTAVGSDIQEEPLDVPHNYARLENHFGTNVMIHRKGAISAREGEYGIIPGSQGSKSYIVRGKGNPESFMSCSHGAGRKMSRTKAQKELNLEEEIKKMNDMGVVHGIRTEKDLDECASAYKDIDTVMQEQQDLVEIITELTPIAVIKG